MSVIEKLPIQWREQADNISAYTTAPHGLTWDHGAADALRRCADDLDALMPAIHQHMIDAERIKRDIEELYDVMPMLPITAEAMEAATDWFTRYCIDFYREINAVQDAAIDARLASDSEGGSDVHA